MNGSLTAGLALAALGCASFGCGSSHPNQIAGTGSGGSGPATGSGGSGPGNGGSGTVGPPTSWGGVGFPWAVYDGTIPDVPPSATGKTYYADPVNGNDSYDGSSFTFVSGTTGPKKTAGAAMKNAKAGDTVLLGGGLYREYPTISASGKAGSPITIGSYGHGTGAPVIDGGLQAASWTKYTAQGQTTVWQTSTASLSKLSQFPVLGIYVNGPNGESALKEVIHGQVTKYDSDPLPANQTQANITDNSNNWYFDKSGKVLYADFGGSLGTGDPNQADVSILYNSHDSGNAEPLLNLASDYLSFIGITVRAASWSGVYLQGNHVSFDQCDVKFSGGGGFSWGGDSNSVTRSRIWMNVLDNWPRFNNGNTGGGWPGALVFQTATNGTARGNAVYQNGGEGIIFYDTEKGYTGTGNLVANNVVYDNFSVNIYTDNTQGVTVEQNFVFNHPRDASQTFAGLLTTSPGYNEDFGRRLSPVGIALADEPGSAYDGQAHLANITVINNIVVGADRALEDYDDGTSGVGHGLKNDLIANNTLVVGLTPLPGGFTSYGWSNGSNPGADMNSFVENNVIVVQNSGDFFESTSANGIGAGITNDYTLYTGPGTWANDVASNAQTQTFAQWQSGHSGWDKHSTQGDAMLTDITAFNQTAAQAAVYDWTKAVPLAGSAVHRAGTTQTAFTTDFTGATRPSGNYDLGAIAMP
ncbi:MAG TPA: right-handed parallel beta-helix repeat-containing protein [Polyangia bacterium]|nr:right-handed parallel beta-helix repeat-containing protein [Polyangia bacterium]